MNRWTLFALTTAGIVLAGTACTPSDQGLSEKNTATTESDSKTGSKDTSTPTNDAVTQTPPAPAEIPLPDKPKDGDDVAVLETSAGKIVVMFYPSKAPRHVENFMNLAKKGLYNGTRFHRCIPGFMIQGGDPKSKDLAKAAEWGTGGNMAGGQEQRLPAEFNDIHHARGVLSMARGGDPDSASSQFFIMVADNPGLDGQYSAFGNVVSGMEVADKIVESGDPNANGAVDPKSAFVLKSVKVTKWPIK